MARVPRYWSVVFTIIRSGNFVSSVSDRHVSFFSNDLLAFITQDIRDEVARWS
jgi:hypothetical protein